MELLFCGRHSSKPFKCIYLGNFYKSSEASVIIIPILQRDNWDNERLNDLLKVICLESWGKQGVNSGGLGLAISLVLRDMIHLR